MIEIKKAKIADSQKIRDIYNSATLKLLKDNIFMWKYPFHINEIKNEIMLSNFYCVYKNDNIVGCFGIKEWIDYEVELPNDRKNYFWYKLVIDPKFQNQGIYKHILEFVKKFAKINNVNLFLSSYSQNTKNNLRYEKSGFKLYKVNYDRITHNEFKNFFSYYVYILSE